MANESTRRTLIKCMKKLVREHSFSQISIDSICELAHISRRTFYRYFPDKYSLLETTYLEGFFNKLDTSDVANFWDLFRKLCEQIYSEQSFFSHAFDVKGQNGFWEEATKIIAPYMRRDFPVTDDIREMVEFYISNDIDVLFQLIERWIKDGYNMTPEQFSARTHDSFKVHGKWIYEVATGRPLTGYTQQKLDNHEW